VRPRGRGLRFSFRRTSSRRAQIDVFRQSRGRSIRRLNRVATFRGRRRGFTWRARGLPNGYYVVRFRIGQADGKADLRRIAVRRRNGRFTVRPAFQRVDSCRSLIGAFRLSRPVFGGRQRRPLYASFRVNQAADVKLTVRRGGRIVRTTTRRRYVGGRQVTVRLTPPGRARGDYSVEISAERAGRTATARLTARRL
jgi:hypothetical protein